MPFVWPTMTHHDGYSVVEGLFPTITITTRIPCLFIFFACAQHRHLTDGLLVWNHDLPRIPLQRWCAWLLWNPDLHSLWWPQEYLLNCCTFWNSSDASIPSFPSLIVLNKTTSKWFPPTVNLGQHKRQARKNNPLKVQLISFLSPLSSWVIFWLAKLSAKELGMA